MPNHKLVLGFAHWGTAKVSLKDIIETIRLAVEAGIDEIDCAPHYGGGKNENLLGIILSDLPEEIRSRIKISTKVGRIMDPNIPAESSNGFTNHSGFSQFFDYSKKGIRESFGQSQLRMSLAKIHALYLHDLDKNTHKENFEKRYKHFIEDGYLAFDNLKEDGRINVAGIGSNDAKSCVELIKDGRFKIDRIMLAGCYNLLNFSGLDELFPLCEEKNIELYIAAPYGGGLLSNPKENQFYRYEQASSELMQRVEKIQAICNEFNIPLAHAAMQFVHMHPQIKKVVVGARTPEELKLSLEYALTPITPKFWEALKKADLIPANTVIPVLQPKITHSIFSKIEEHPAEIKDPQIEATI